jgi:MYXO-CTERM domain-containing protein
VQARRTFALDHELSGLRRVARRRSWRALPALALLLSLGCERPPEPPSIVALSALSVAEQKVVYGDDDRRDVYQLMDPALIALVDSSVVLVDEGDIIAADPNNVLFDAITLGQYLGLCADESYTDQPNMGFCSGSLIDDDLVLTAGHCMRNNNDCADTRFVFNVYYEAPGALHNVQLARDVFACDEILTTVEAGDLDFAIVRLDRSAVAQGKQPVTLVSGPTVVDQDIVLVGYPTGIPLKFDAGGHVLNPGFGPAPVAFRGTPDAFGGNSGSPVFTSNYEQVGILVAGQTDYAYDNNAMCTRVNVLGADQGPGEVMTYAQRAIETLCDDLAYPSQRLCPQNFDPSCNACPDEPCPEFWDCGTHPDNPNVSFCRQPCMGDDDCSDGFACADDFFCSPTLTSTCQNDAVWTIDACDNLVAQTEVCAFTCADGACSEPEVGDTCASPIPMDVLPGLQIIVGNSNGAADDYEGGCPGQDGAEEVFTFTLEQNYEVEFYTSGFDTLIHLREGNCESPASEVFCNDDSGQGTDSRWQGELGPGTYYFFMDAWGSFNSGGEYTLQATFTPLDECVDACMFGDLRCRQNGPPGIEGCGPGPEGCNIWQFILPCDEGCENGQCVGDTCMDECPFDGATACLNNTTFGICGQFDDDECLDAAIEMCVPGDVCVEGQGCEPDACLQCDPGEQRCAGPDLVERCELDPEGCTFWVPDEVCDNGFCDNGACVGECFDECFPGDEFCFDPFTYLPCGQFDNDPCFEFGQPESCAPGTECVAGACVAACGEDCAIGAQRCRVDGLMETCILEDDGCSAWDAPFACPNGGVCDQLTDQCPDGCPGECTLGEAECLGDSSYRVCLDEDGDGCASFTGPRFCFGATVCEEGLCVLDNAPIDAGPGPDEDAGPITFPARSSPERVRIAPAANCAQSTPSGLLPLVGLLGLAAWRRRARGRS